MAMSGPAVNLENTKFSSSKPGNDGTRCPTCEKCFSRPEHLRRHMTVHTEDKVYSCQFCNKKFARKDAAQRHSLAHDATDDPSRATGKVALRGACIQCRQSRVKCTGSVPCQYCAKKNRDCQYLPGKRKWAAIDGPEIGRCANVDFEPPLSHAQSPESRRRDRSSERLPREGDPSTIVLHGGADSSAEDSPVQRQAEQPVLLFPQTDVHHNSTTGSQISSYGIILGSPREPFNFSSNSDAQLADNTTQLSHTQHSPQGTSPFDMAIFDTNWLPLDDVAFSSYPPIIADTSDLPGSELVQNFEGVATAQCQSDAFLNFNCGIAHASEFAGQDASQRPRSRDGKAREDQRDNQLKTKRTFYVDGTGARSTWVEQAGSRRKSSQLTTLSPSEPSPLSASGLTNPLPKTIDDQVKQICASDLIQPPVNVEVYNEILEKLATAPFSSECRFHPFSSEQFPSIRTLGYFVQLYFENFHVVYPFLDRSVLSVPFWGAYITLATAAIGARYMSSGDAETCSDALVGLLHQIFSHEYDLDGAEESLIYVQARALSAIGLCHSRRIAWIKIGYKTAGMVFAACARLELLKEITDDGQVTEHDYIECSWIRWRVRESRRRTGLFIWMFNSIASFTFQLPSQLPLSCLHLMLPSSEHLWQAPNSQVWQSLREEQSKNVPIQEMLHILYTEHKLKHQISEFAGMVLVHCIIQRTMEVGTFYKIPLSQWTPAGSGIRQPRSQNTGNVSYLADLPDFAKWRNSACDALDVLHWDALGISAKKGGVEGPIFLKLHLARVVLLAPIQELEAVIHSFSAESHPTFLSHDKSAFGRSQEECHMTIWTWMTRDKYKARLAVLHASATFWHLRRFPADCYLQPFALFLATVILWAYGAYSIHGEQLVQPQEKTNGASYAERRTIDQDQDVHDAIEDPEVFPSQADQSSTPSGSPTPANAHIPKFMHIDRPFDDEIAQHFIRSGDAMQLYIERVGELCTLGGPELVLREGARLLRRENCVWPIAEHFATTLGAVASNYSTKLFARRR